MPSNWLAASSFEEALKLVEAINDLSTSTKLMLAHIDNPTPLERIDASRQLLKEFLEWFQTVVQAVESNESSPILGTDPRSGELVRRYLAHKKNQLKPTGLYSTSLDSLLQLLSSDTSDDLRLLIECLSDLRELVEQHSQIDVNNILGEL